MTDNPPIRLTNQQFHALNRAVAVAEVALQAQGWHHHDQAIKDARAVPARCEVDDLSFDLASLLGKREAV